MPDVCSALFKEADDMSLRLLGKFIKPLDGAVGLLKKIKTKGGKIAVATSDRTQRAMLAMKFLKIDKVVDLVVGTDKVEVTKPAPDMLKFIASHFKVTTDRSCIVGDALTDIQMGLNAGFKASIAVLGGVSRKEELKKLTPYVIKNISCMDVA
jgi:phosphoglycolate phosphatase